MIHKLKFNTGRVVEIDDKDLPMFFESEQSVSQKIFVFHVNGKEYVLRTTKNKGLLLTAKEN